MKIHLASYQRHMLYMQRQRQPTILLIQTFTVSQYSWYYIFEGRVAGLACAATTALMPVALLHRFGAGGPLHGR